VSAGDARPPAGLRITASAEATEALGEALAAGLAPGDVLALSGPLGSGKTRFVAGLARGLGVAARVRSPSFTLLNEYRGRLELFHLDLYRVPEIDVADLGLEERLERGVLAVEWGEKLPASLRADALALRFEIRSAAERAIDAEGRGPRGAQLLARWRALPLVEVP